jgi:hypothetical protein
MEDLTLAEAAALLRRHPELVRQWLAGGRLVGRKRAGAWFVNTREVRQFMRHEPLRRERRATAKPPVTRRSTSRRRKAK